MVVVKMRCTCVSEYQDKKYGKGCRLWNLMRRASPQAQQKARCTVCQMEKGVV